MTIVHTGKFLDDATRERLAALHRFAMTTPVMVVSQRYLGPNGKDEATLARERFNRAMNEAAVNLGLPEPIRYVDEDGDDAIINYGADMKTGEVLGWEKD